jgi:RNA polymerase sigma-70 factor (ECF subfamily)
VPEATSGETNSADHPDAASGASQFDALFCEYLPKLYRRAVLLAGESAAEDAVHEVYLKLASRPQRVLDHAHPYAYIVAALVSVVRDDLRRRRRLVAVAEVPERADAQHAVEVSDAQWQATWLLRQLSVGQAAAVLLVDLDGYTIDEAASVLGVHRGTVSRARRRALHALRDVVKDEER